jgi:hypothetical protein
MRFQVAVQVESPGALPRTPGYLEKDEGGKGLARGGRLALVRVGTRWEGSE